MRDLITILAVVINVASMFAMIVGILLHSGRGGGLSDMFGGGGGAAARGPRNGGFCAHCRAQ